MAWTRHADTQNSDTTPGTPWHGTERGTRRFMARHGTENIGTENFGPGTENIGTEKSWHDMAREHIIKLFFRLF